MNPPNNIPFWGPGAMYNSLMRFNLKKNEKKLHFRCFEAVRGLFQHIFLVRPGGHMCPPITLCCFFSSKFKLVRKFFYLAFFQMLISHCSIKIWLIFPTYLGWLLNSFPKWYDTWYPMKIEHFMARRLRSYVFVKNFEITLGSYLGH